MLRDYRFGFDAWALVLFCAMMLPNVLWFALPAPDDVLRAESITGAVDMVASVLQALMIAALCLLKRSDEENTKRTWLVVLAVCCCGAYYACWGLYYAAIVAAPVILGLTIFPCLAFIFYAAYRRNMIALVLACAFAVCHAIFGMVNFIL